MIAVVIIYIVLITIFFIFAGLIFRHAIKFSYLSQRFKTITFIFGLMALAIVIFSMVMLLQLYSGTSNKSPSVPKTNTSGGGNLNF
ncbi:hypothetical protein COY07_06380 [Candidatus Peregrinibacteria bacterium CG_4_10_14_0_2_um_filter_43_11]|nr:MAG: hypothetical protein COY07_06380 [Candidatus Peregrinibacteria bacterium CG_4_10_14_0_2_um_filter_43_11]